MNEEYRPGACVVLAMYIGLSVSLCIKDVLKGIIIEEQIAYIIAGTYVKGPDSLEGLAQQYGNTYWSSDPDRGKSILKRLWYAGKILQPRAINGEPPNIAGGYWVKYVPTYLG